MWPIINILMWVQDALLAGRGGLSTWDVGRNDVPLKALCSNGKP